MLQGYNLFMKKISFLICLSILCAKEPKSMDEFVYDHFMLTKSKMECSPTLWLDVQEGYLRHIANYHQSVKVFNHIQVY